MVLILTIPLLMYFLFGDWIVNHDVSIKLYLTQNKFLFSQKLYIDVLEHGPPYLYIPYDVIYGLFKLSQVESFQVFYLSFVLLNVCTSISIANHLMQRSNIESALFLLSLFFLLLFFPGENWGQKEHLSAIWIVPYIAIRLLDLTKVTHKAVSLTALLLALSLMIRPNFILIFFVIELYTLISFRKKYFCCKLYTFIFTILTIIFLSSLYIYLTYTTIQLSAYYHYTLTELHGSRSLFYQPLTNILFRYAIFFIPPTIATITVIRRKGHGLIPLLYLTIICIAFFIAAVIFKTDWSYRYIPFHISSILLMLILIDKLIKRTSSYKMIKLSFATLIIVCSIAFPLYALLNERELPSYFHDLDGSKIRTRRISKIIKTHSKPGNYIAYFSTVVLPKFPVVFITEQKTSGKYLAFESLPNQYKNELDRLASGKYHSSSELTPIEKDIHQDILKELTLNNPTLIVIEHHNQPVKTLDLHRYIFHYKKFKHIFSNYKILVSNQFNVTILKKHLRASPL